jgi:asparagine synthase (glutamine-hydrolysing)
MCGISASFGTKSALPIGKLAHRGPDQFTKFNRDWIHVEFARLAITGGVEGASPVGSKNGRWIIFLNGEIYNFKSLQLSHALPFTNSDTHLVAEGLAKNGPLFLKNLRGMYALICIDLWEDKVFIARDPIGEKPLFYTQKDKTMFFSSEFKNLLEINPLSGNINSQSISNYFRFSYIEEPYTIHDQILAFDRGACVSLSRESTQLKFEFALAGYDEDELKLSLEDLLVILSKEVGYSTVKSGIALSGGVDSSSALELFTKNRISEVTPLIVHFPFSPELSERNEALSFAADYSLKAIQIDILPEDVIDSYQKYLELNDQPHADFAGINYFNIFKKAQEHGFKIVHFGHGPDEFFWGYDWLYSHLTPRNKIFSPKRRGAPDQGLIEFWDTPAFSKLHENLRFQQNFVSERLLRMAPHDDYLRSSNYWKKTRASITHSYLSTNGLRQSDRLGMQHSVEARTLFADSRLYGWSQANSKQDSRSFQKREFRDAINFSYRPEKSKAIKKGFRTPLQSLIGESNFFQDLVHQACNDSMIDWNLLPDENTLSFVDKHRLISIDTWLRRYY